MKEPLEYVRIILVPNPTRPGTWHHLLSVKTPAAMIERQSVARSLEGLFEDWRTILSAWEPEKQGEVEHD